MKSGQGQSEAAHRTPAMIHAQMYAMGEKYMVQGLKNTAAWEFKRYIGWVTGETWALIVQEVYTNTPDNDRTLRDIIALFATNERPDEPVPRHWYNFRIDIPRFQYDLLMIRKGMLKLEDEPWKTWRFRGWTNVPQPNIGHLVAAGLHDTSNSPLTIQNGARPRHDLDQRFANLLFANSRMIDLNRYLACDRLHSMESLGRVLEPNRELQHLLIKLWIKHNCLLNTNATQLFKNVRCVEEIRRLRALVRSLGGNPKPQ